MYSNQQGFSNAPIVYPELDYQPLKLYHQGSPRFHDFQKEIIFHVASKYDFMTVGAISNFSRDDALKYVNAKEKEMNMMILFEDIEVGFEMDNRFNYKGLKFSELKKAINSISSFAEGTKA